MLKTGYRGSYPDYLTREPSATVSVEPLTRHAAEARTTHA